jgi:DNA replication protein DnaC
MTISAAVIITSEENPMLNQALFDKLIQLRLPAFRTGLLEQQTNSKYAELSFEERLAILVDLECTRRHSNRIQRLVKAAEFPLPAAIEDLDLAASRGLERSLVLELSQCAWVQNHLNLFVLGPTGSGKTYVACALAMSACRSRFSVRYFRTSRLLHRLTLARQDNSYHTLLHSLAKIDLIILDDWMRDAITVPNAQDLLELLDDRFGCSSTIVASQVPIHEWHSRIPDPTLADAVLDRLIHNAHRLNLEGESQRKLRAIRSMPST